MLSRVHRLPHGSEWRPDTGTKILHWAAGYAIGAVIVDCGDPVRLTPAEGGWHRGTLASARPGARYQFVLPDGMRVPDPASRYQPDDVHGPSEIMDPAAYAWSDGGWD